MPSGDGLLRQEFDNAAPDSDRGVAPRSVRAIRRAAGILLPIAAFLLPFELSQPLFRVGPFGITNVELALYGVIGLWLVGILRGVWGTFDVIRLALMVWLAALFLSAATAPSHGAEALKFCLRSAGAALVALAAADMAKDRGIMARCLTALAAGGCLSALAGVIEVAVPPAGKLLSPFRTQPSFLLGRIRASGTFEYANIAAMFWEAALVALVALCPRSTARRTLPGRAVCIAGAALLVEAVTLTRSRASLVVIAVYLPCLWIVARRSLPALRTPILWMGAALSVSLVLHSADRDILGMRFSGSSATDWYRAEFRCPSSPVRLRAGTSERIAVTVTNSGQAIWPADGKDAVAISYHWFSRDGETAIMWECPRHRLPRNTGPSESVTVDVTVYAPPEAGTYELRWDVVQDDKFWFSELSGPARGETVEVWALPGEGPSFSLPPPVRFGPYRPVERLVLWKAALLMWSEHPILGVGPDNFRRRYGPYAGMSSFDDRVHTNNLYLEMLVNTGFLGLLAWLVFSTLLACRAIRAWKSSADPAQRMLLVGVAGGIAAFYLHGFADYHLAFTPTYGLFFLLAGILMATPGPEGQ